MYTKFDDVPCSHSSENVAHNRSTNEAAPLVVALATWQERHQSCMRLEAFGSLFSHFCQKDVVGHPKMMSLGQKK